MGTMASQITSLPIVYSTVYSDADQRKHESSASLAFARGIHRGPMNSPHKWPVTRKMFPFDDIIMWESLATCLRRGYVNLLIHTKLYDVVTHPYVQNVWCNYVSMPLSRTKYMISHKKVRETCLTILMKPELTTDIYLVHWATAGTWVCIRTAHMYNL